MTAYAEVNKSYKKGHCDIEVTLVFIEMPVQWAWLRCELSHWGGIYWTRMVALKKNVCVDYKYIMKGCWFMCMIKM